MAETAAAVELVQKERYRFEASFPGSGLGTLVVDEPRPLGEGAGPGPTRALATAVGHCMSSSLVFALARAHIPCTPLRTSVSVEVARNEKGRLRVSRIGLAIATRPLREEDRPRFDECVRIFEEFCTVSAAVRQGIPIATQIDAGAAAPTGPDR